MRLLFLCLLSGTFLVQFTTSRPQDDYVKVELLDEVPSWLAQQLSTGTSNNNNNRGGAPASVSGPRQQGSFTRRPPTSDDALVLNIGDGNVLHIVPDGNQPNTGNSRGQQPEIVVYDLTNNQPNQQYAQKGNAAGNSPTQNQFTQNQRGGGYPAQSNRPQQKSPEQIYIEEIIHGRPTPAPTARPTTTTPPPTTPPTTTPTPPPLTDKDTNQREPPPDHRGPPPDHRGPPPDRRGPPPDRRGPPPDHRGPPHDRRGPPDDWRRDYDRPPPYDRDWNWPPPPHRHGPPPRHWGGPPPHHWGGGPPPHRRGPPPPYYDRDWRDERDEYQGDERRARPSPNDVYKPGKGTPLTNDSDSGSLNSAPNAVGPNGLFQAPAITPEA